MEKRLVKIVIISFFFAINFATSSAVYANQDENVNKSQYEVALIEPNAVIPPTKIWWSFTVHTDFGNFYYTTIARKDGVYRGYLQKNWQKSIGGYYTYEGYLYPENSPFPIPSKIIE